MPFPFFGSSQEKFVRHAAPNKETLLSPEDWAKGMADEILKHGRKQIALFDPFPPEYVDYYKALQVTLARRIPEEQNRPLICLNIKGRNKLGDTSRADVGMAGGTGPLSDATILEKLVAQMSSVDPAAIASNREKVADTMQNFTGVLYSMPPFRDFNHFLKDSYFPLYNFARQNWPCISLHILTNTGHSNQWLFDTRTLLGPSRYGLVNDLTRKVSETIQTQAKPDSAVLILGTLAADQAELYPLLLSKKHLAPILPTWYFCGEDAKTYLQKIIDQAKAGKITEDMPDESRTCGQAFVDYVVHCADIATFDSILFSCTELPMLLHTQIPGENQTYFDKLKIALSHFEHRRYPFQYFDSEEIFIEEIIQKSNRLQTDEAYRNRAEKLMSKFSATEIQSFLSQYDSIKSSLETHLAILEGDITGQNPVARQHRIKLVQATLNYLKDGNEDKLDEALSANYSFDDTKIPMGYNTSELVWQAIHYHHYAVKNNIFEPEPGSEPGPTP